MAAKFNAILNMISHYKYLIVVVIGVAVVGFIDDNSFMKRAQYEIQINTLKAEIEKYNAIYEADSKRLAEIGNDPKAIERIARERYFMKTDDEDIFVLSDDIQPQNSLNETVE